MSGAKKGEEAPGVRTFRPYPAYKDSGVDWLAQIPTHWTVAPVYARYEVALGKMLDAKRITGKHSGHYLRNVDVQWDRVNVDGLPQMDFAPSERARYLLRSGDLLVCEGGAVGRTAVWLNQLDECFYQKAIHRVRPLRESEHPRYFYYLMHSLAKKGLFVAGGNPNTIDHLPADKLKHYRLPFAPPAEQQAIAKFLDRETAKIDALVAKKERLIELLHEQRTSLITNAVTKGLDPSVAMKESGVEWLGEIPSDWTVTRIRDIAEALQTGPFGSQLHADEYVTGGCPVINPANLRDGELVPDWDCTVDETTAQRLDRHRLIANDILFARRGEMGRCGLATQQQAGWICGTGSLRVRTRIDLARPAFLLQALSTSGIRDWLQLQSVGSTMQNLNTAIIGRIPVAFPRVREQDAIVAFLDGQKTKLDALAATIHVAIDRLKELRTVLISAAVTGKIDVRQEIP